METYNLNVDGVEFTIKKNEDVWGDGQHGSTQMMMQFISKYGVKDKSVIDVGTGTGILSVLCGKLGAKDILAIDCDDKVLECAEANFKANNVKARTLKNDLLRGVDEKADVVVANLPFVMQFQLVGQVKNILKDDGLFIMLWEHPYYYDKFVKGYEIVDCTKGERYDGYVLKKMEVHNDEKLGKKSN